MDVLQQWMRMHDRPDLTLVRSEVRAPWGFLLPAGASVAFHLMRRGSAVLMRDGLPPLDIAEGDLIVISNGAAHAMADRVGTPPDPVDVFARRSFTFAASGPDAVIFCGQLRTTALLGQRGLAALPPFLHLPAAEIAADAGIAGVARLLEDELGGPDQGNEEIVDRLAGALLVYVMRAAATQAGHGAGWLAAMNDPHLARVFRAIHGEPARMWTVEAMADVAGLSRAAFARRFASRVGAPPLGYLSAWRMALAARRLRGGRCPVRVVASEVGYESEAAFSRAFKTHHGVSPARYREAIAPRQAAS